MDIQKQYAVVRNKIREIEKTYEKRIVFIKGGKFDGRKAILDTVSHDEIYDKNGVSGFYIIASCLIFRMKPVKDDWDFIHDDFCNHLVTLDNYELTDEYYEGTTNWYTWRADNL